MENTTDDTERKGRKGREGKGKEGNALMVRVREARQDKEYGEGETAQVRQAMSGWRCSGSQKTLKGREYEVDREAKGTQRLEASDKAM